jgi:hypothetical protein
MTLRDRDGTRAAGPGPAVHVSRRRPAEQLRPEHEERIAALEHERAVWEIVVRRLPERVRTRQRVDALLVEMRIDRIGALVPRMTVGPDRAEAVVVLPPAERARAMSGGEGRHLVGEEELGEPSRLHERAAVPAPELEPAGDPALPAVPPSDAARLVVQAAAIPVDETARRVGDQLAERRRAVLERHR